MAAYCEDRPYIDGELTIEKLRTLDTDFPQIVRRVFDRGPNMDTMDYVFTIELTNGEKVDFAVPRKLLQESMSSPTYFYMAPNTAGNDLAYQTLRKCLNLAVMHASACNINYNKETQNERNTGPTLRIADAREDSKDAQRP